MKTRTTTRRSGQSTAGSSKPAGRNNGDPYLPVCEHLHNLLSRKRGYYGCPTDGPLSNALGVAEDGIEPWVYQLARIGEKCRRLRGDARNQDTLVIETLYDIAGHAAVAIACIQAKAGAKNES
jgi:hypothetical protein